MKINSEQEMLAFGQKFAKTLQPPAVIELVGDVGAGKTTFTRGLAKGLGISDPVTSPSFTISKSYALPSGGNLVHYDFYRLSDPGLMKHDLDEKINSCKNILIIEWANSVKDFLPKNKITINITKNNDNSRNIEVRNNRDNTFRDILRPTGSNLARSPVTTEQRGENRPSLLSLSSEAARSPQMGATKRVEKGIIRLFLDTSTPETILRINDHEYRYNFDHDLAEKLLGFIHDKLAENNCTFHDITEITFMSGPGSFTGLRIGASIVNTLAHELNIPLYDHHRVKHQIILPDYGRPAHITAPKK